MVRRLHRRLLAGAIAVLVPALAGCEAGLNAPTQEFHPAANGATADTNGISISNAFVLGAPLHTALPPGGRAGVFLALTAQNGDRLVSVTAPGTAASVRLPGGGVNLPPQALVSLSGPAPAIVLTGLTRQLAGGQTVRLAFDFARAGTVTIQVPVEPHAYEYATYSPPAIPTPTVTALRTPSVSPRATAAAGGNQGTSASPSPAPTATP
jgi:copper(I)-binding protein